MTLSLDAYGGGPPPGGLAEDLAQLANLPDVARARFWEVLGPALGADPLPQEAERKLDVFCAELDLAPDCLAAGLRASRSLVRAAVRRGLTKAALAADLSKLGVGEPTALALLAGYEQAFTALRRQAAVDDIGAHGKLLTAVDWRFDRIMDTKRVKSLGVDVLVVTLRFREAGEERSVTFQVLPDMVDELRRVGTPH